MKTRRILWYITSLAVLALLALPVLPAVAADPVTTVLNIQVDGATDAHVFITEGLDNHSGPPYVLNYAVDPPAPLDGSFLTPSGGNIEVEAGLCYTVWIERPLGTNMLLKNGHGWPEVGTAYATGCTDPAGGLHNLHFTIAVEDTLELTVVKEVVNDNGGVESPDSWTIVIETRDSPTDPWVFFDQKQITDPPGSATFQVFNKTDYRVTEIGPSGYTADFSDFGPGIKHN